MAMGVSFRAAVMVTSGTDAKLHFLPMWQKLTSVSLAAHDEHVNGLHPISAYDLEGVS